VPMIMAHALQGKPWGLRLPVESNGGTSAMSMPGTGPMCRYRALSWRACCGRG